MLRTMRVVAASLGLLCGLVGCTSFLTGDKLSTDPNNPGSATVQTLLVGMQSAQFSLHEGTVAMMMCEWVQACGATNGRFVQGLGLYDFGASANTGANFIDWQLIYTAGGLIDIHTIERDARAAGDSVYLGIGKVWEAFTIGTAADMWGSIPFTQITTSATPDTDPQFAVYDSVQSLLRQAIGELTNGTATLTPPPDLVFGRFGDAPGGDGLASWIKTAYTLRARYWLHVEEAATGARHPSDADRFFGTMLFTDVAGSTELLARIGYAEYRALRATHDGPPTARRRTREARPVALYAEGESLSDDQRHQGS